MSDAPEIPDDETPAAPRGERIAKWLARAGVASRRDAELAAVLRKLWIAGYEVLDGASRHYFEPAEDGPNPTHLFVLTHWLMGGMAMERHLTDGEHVNEHFLQLWCRVLGAHLRPRDGVTTPPPRPAFWDQALTARDD